MTIKATIWDFSGVLVQPKSADPHAQLARELGIPAETLIRYFNTTENWKMDSGLETQADYIQRMIHEQNLPQSAFSLMENFFLSRYMLDERLIAFIQSTRPSLKTAICSNFSDVLRDQIKVRWKIADLFDVIVISNEIGVIKPDPKIYLLTLDRLGLQPEEAIFIDDQEKNVVGAQNVGMHGILFSNSEDAISEIEGILKSQLE